MGKRLLVKEGMGSVNQRIRSIVSYVCLITLFSVSAISLAAKTAAAETGEAITILFTHDLHDHLLPVKDLQDGRIGYTGGFARLDSAIESELVNHPEALLVDAGDFSMGTPFQTIFSSDAPELRIMGEIGYDVVTFGNHEFDYRASGLAESLQSAKASQAVLPQIVQSNTEFPADAQGNLTSSLSALKAAYEACDVKEYTIIEKNGVRIGVFALMGEDAASNAPKSEVVFADPIANAQRVVKLLQQENVDLILCLSHSGTWPKASDSEDEVLANKVPEIDVIISAHTHTKLTEPIVAGDTLIVSGEDSCRYLGALDLVWEGDGRWKPVRYDLRRIDEGLAEDSRIAGMVQDYKEKVQKAYFDRFDLQYDRVLAVSPYNFQNINSLLKTHQEDPLGNLISDAYRYAVQLAEGSEYQPVDAAIVPVGTIRGTFFKGDITAADAFTVSSLGIGADKIPGYPLISVYLTGKELKTVCEVDASISPMMEEAQLFMSGLEFTFNPKRMIFNKVTEASLRKPDGGVEAIEDQELYRVVVGLYSAQMLSIVGDESYGLLSIVPKTEDGTPITDFEAQIIHETTDGVTTEIKEWQAIAWYLQSFESVDGVAQVPEYYAGPHDRKVMDGNTNLLALLSQPNGIALGVYGAAAALILLGIFLVTKITSFSKRKAQKRAEARRK